MGIIIDGKTIASEIRIEVAKKVEQLKTESQLVPKLSVLLIGDDPASQIYVRNKERQCEEVGIQSETHRLPANSKQDQVIEIIDTLNNDPRTHGILVQLPLPKGLDEIAILNAISPEKDVDGLHPMNLGKLLKGERPAFLPCTPSG